MKSFLTTIGNALKRGGFAFLYYPVSMTFAICLALLSIWMIETAPQTNQKLFQSLQLAFFFGAVANMAFCVLAKKISDRKGVFLLANFTALIVSTGAFFLLFLTAGNSISSDNIVRILSGTGVSFLVFLAAPTIRAKKIQYNQMIFMTLKSFFIAAVYSLVIMLGVFFIAFAVQTLLYSKMSSNVYSYIAILSALFGYAFFLGYFPAFTVEEDENDERIEKAVRQPRFAEILFQNILIPIFAALTFVLILWSVQILVTRVWPDYTQTLAIFSTYALSGIFLYFLVSSYETVLPRIFRKVVPFTILLFLAFETYPIINHISLYGVKITEYGVGFIWIYAVASSVMFIFLPVVKNRIPSYLAMVLITVFALPGIGASDFTYTLQVKRLQHILIQNGMFQNDKIIPGKDVPAQARLDITDAVEYIASMDNKTAPKWLISVTDKNSRFDVIYGFSQEYYPNSNRTPQDVSSNYFVLRPDFNPIALENYQYFISRDSLNNKSDFEIETQKGKYLITCNIFGVEAKNGSSLPGILIKLNNSTVLDAKMDTFQKQLLDKYQSGTYGMANGDKTVPAADLSWTAVGSGVQVKFVFQSVSFSTDSAGTVTPSYDLQGIYFKELN